MDSRPRLVAEQLDCVRGSRLGCQDPARCWGLGHCAFTRPESRRFMLGGRPPKREARIKDPSAIRAKMRNEKRCRCGCGRPATDAHHVVFRSQGGDDVRENIVGLAHDDHMFFHVSPDDEMRAAVGASLRDDEIAYVLAKKGEEQGWDYLGRVYRVERREIERTA